MNRSITNTIRFVMDELIPPFVRDSKIFMYPFYLFAYRGRNIREVMAFKSKVYAYSPEQYASFYNNLNTISRNRATDMNVACIDFILNSIDSTATNIIDIGCGSGYLLGKIEQKFPAIKRTGFDIKVASGKETFTYVHGNIEKLPFEDSAFDVVICCHTIEHLLQLESCISELKRITKKQLFIVTPCQRFFYYTLDEHVNFFPYKEKLIAILPFDHYECHKLQGDWAYLGTKNDVE